jgi:hypothetical protein
VKNAAVAGRSPFGPDEPWRGIAQSSLFCGMPCPLPPVSSIDELIIGSLQAIAAANQPPWYLLRLLASRSIALAPKCYGSSPQAGVTLRYES